MKASAMLPRLVLYRLCSSSSGLLCHPEARYETKGYFTEDDVRSFANLTGDNNPIHLNQDFAKVHFLGQRVVHGALINGFVAGIIGTKLPGFGTVLVEQRNRFPHPLYIGESFVATVSVTSVKMSRIVCAYQCVTENGRVVFEGEAKLIKK